MVLTALLYQSNRHQILDGRYYQQLQSKQTQKMFKQAFGSPRLGSKQEQPDTSILSPRNFLKMIASSIGDLRRTNISSPNQANYQQFLSTFTPYLESFQEEYRKYNQAKYKSVKRNSKNQELQLELKINRIPTIYFMDCELFQLQLCKRTEARKKQEELTEYLDEIELALFSKAGKYPEKSHIILENMGTLTTQANNSLAKVIEFRRQIREKALVVSSKQLKIKLIQERLFRIKYTLEYAEVMRKMKDLRDFSSTQYDKNSNNQQILLRVKKTDLQQCNKFYSLRQITKNIQNYRTAVKEKLYSQFLSEIQHIITTLLKYNKEDWKSINVPQSIFHAQNNLNVSHNNITILDQSYFAFEMNQVNIVNRKPNLSPIIREESEEENNEDVLDLTMICKLWGLIKQFDLYDPQEVNEHFTKLLIRHNISFNHDMEEYICYLSQTKKKEQTISNILKGPQTYAALKAAQKEEQKSKEINSDTNIQANQDKISEIDMKLFLKVVKFEYLLIKKVMSFLNDYRQLQFLSNFKLKLADFLQSIITYFANAKKITHQLSVQNFLVYLQIIYFWQHEQFYEIVPFCQRLKTTKIDEYLTNIQKNLLIKELKQSIEQSTYCPINVSSNNYMTFHYLLSPNSIPQCEDVNMSITMQLQQGRQEEEKEEDVILRLINKNIIYRDKAYKICDSFLILIRNIQRFKKLKDQLGELQQNIQEKICELIGFYAWYNQKNLINSKTGSKTLKNYCAFFSTLLLLKQILATLAITNKKIEKTKVQLNDCETQISKSISMTPFMTIEYQISQLYDSKISAKPQIPTSQSLRIIEVLKISFDCLKEYFPIEYEQKLHQSYIVKFMQTTIKLLSKNYFGYLSNMEKRGLAQIKWFLPKLREVTEITVVRDNNLVNKKGELLCRNGSSTFCIFNDEIQEMQRLLKQKSMGK